MMKINEKAPRKLGLYIHIPFCRSKCLYCDFCSYVGAKAQNIQEYVDVLCKEIRAKSNFDYEVDTIYFGGGTPSLLEEGQIAFILSTVFTSFQVDDDVEITLECNPLTRGCDAKEYFEKLRHLGVNRLSIGVQSAIDGELKLIGRRHTFEEARHTFCVAREAGFDNVSLDLMFGIPSQTIESLEISVNELLKLEPEHISIYSLQLENGTPLYRMRERYALADDDTMAEMYERVVSLMRNAGYSHYEISNFAKEGRESRHNSKYWTLDEYLGFGVAAHSDFMGKRIENTKNIEKYLIGDYQENEEAISEKERELEFLMLGLRTRKGISKAEFFDRFGLNFDEKYGKKIEKYEKMGYFCEDSDRVALNERGFEVSNSILSEILDFDY